MMRGVKRAIATVLVAGLATAPVAFGSSPLPPPDPATTVIAKYRQRIPELMAQQAVPGLAVALVDGNRALWVEGFGSTERRGGSPVTGNTMFSVQSMSKLFTATAVMQSVRAGRLDLDEPVTTYLPRFTVHSAFERHPERRITLRMLLGHTAGFTHEAPVGNNYELDPGEFEAHVRSISDTWLRFPVGSGFAYSSLGIDLAGYILERVEGRPFAEVMRTALLSPLGMDRSTFDRSVIRSSDERAVGHVDPYPAPPLDEPMTAAGGMYSSAADLARFLRFQLSGGSLDGRVVLDQKSIEEMRTVPAPHAGAPAGYALGVARTRWNRWDQRPDLFTHAGGGYGFLSDLWWLPQLQLGVAILTNSQDHQLQGDLALSILGDLVAEPGSYRDRLQALPSRTTVIDPRGPFDPPPGMTDLLAKAAMAATGDEATRWAAYSGRYRAPIWGVLDFGPPHRFVVEANIPYFELTDGSAAPVRHRLFEVEPGLFLTDDGETLDLRGQVPTWANVRLVRVAGGPSPWQWAILGSAALAAVTWLTLAAIRSLRRRRSRLASPRQPAAASRRIAGAFATLTALLMLLSVALVARLPGLVDAGFLGRLELPLGQRLAMHLPWALAVVGGCALALATAGWIRHWWTRGVRLQYFALTAAAIGLIAQLAAWQLIGWGMS